MGTFTNTGAASLFRGDVVCFDAATAGAGNVVKAFPAPLAAAGSVVGVVTDAGPITTGNNVVVSESGPLDQTRTNLAAAGATNLVAVDENALLVRVPRPNGSEFVVGTCTPNGDMVVQPRASRDTSAQHVFNVCSYAAVS